MKSGVGKQIFLFIISFNYLCKKYSENHSINTISIQMYLTKVVIGS